MLISAILLLALTATATATATATTVVAVVGPGSENVFGDNQCPNIRNQVVDNLQICFKKCEYNPRCTAVNACPSGKNMRCIQRGCSLPVPTPTGTWSGCFGHVVKEQCQVEMDVDYPGNNINNGHPNKTSSYQECRTLCEETLGCKAFSWSNGGHQADCWLKSKISGSSPSTGSVSGKACKPKTCLPEEGVDYAGNDINPDGGALWDKRDTHEECKTLCEETSGCNFYTWKQNQECWLKSKRSNTRRYGSNYVSGFPCTTCASTPDTTSETDTKTRPSTQGSCKAPNLMDSKTYNRLKQKYLALDRNNEKKYRQEVEKLLPELLIHGNLTSQEIGIAKPVTDQSQYPLALLEGDDINLVRVPSKVVRINGTWVDWIGKRNYAAGTYRPTGLCAAPGEIVTLTISEDLVGKIRVYIGHLHYKLNFGELKRSKQKIASPFGGLIVIRVMRKDIGMFDVTVENAIEAPNFVFGKNSNDDWNRMKHLAVPWTVLTVPGQMAIYIETLKMKSVTNMTGVMAPVKESMDVFEEMLGVPRGFQPGEERVIYDPKMGGGGYTWVYLYAGVVLCTGAGESVIAANYYTSLIDNFYSSVVFHEIGHRGCYPDLPASGGQWNAEIVRRYIEIKRGLVNWDSWGSPWTVLKNMVGYKIFSKGKPCYEADSAKKFPSGIWYKVNSYENCWTVLFRFPLKEFGWDTLRKVFSWNTDEDKYSIIKYSSGQIKSNRLAELYCKATGHNMIPFYNFFNINITSSAATHCQTLPLPKKMTDYVKVASCIANRGIKDLDCAKMPEFQRISKEDKGVCLISGACQRDPDQENKSTTFDNHIDIFGANKTRDTEQGCHDQAKEYFVRCGNDENHPITATYTLKNGRSTNATVPVFPLPAGNCYSNVPGPSGRITMPHYTGSLSTMLPAVCNKRCKDKNYSYFGLEWYSECWCGNKAPSPAAKLEMKKCNAMCTANSSLRCGGGYAENVWKVCTGENCNFSYE